MASVTDVQQQASNDDILISRDSSSSFGQSAEAMVRRYAGPSRR